MMEIDVLRIETCAKQGDQFIPIDKLTILTLKDPMYVDGSIRVSVRGKPLITDVEWTDIVHWWAGMSNVLRDLTRDAKSVADGYFPDWPGKMRFEVVGETLTWTVFVPEARVATLDRVSTLRRLMCEYRLFFERMKVLNPSRVGDYDVSLDYMSRFRPV